MQIAIKIQFLMGETLRESRMHKNKIELSIKESSWLHKFNIEDLDVAMARHPLEV